MKTICKVDGQDFSAIVTAVEQTFNVVEGSNSGYAIHNNREIRDILGVKIGHVVTFAADNDPITFDALTDYLFKTVRPSVLVEMIDGQDVLTYEAAYNTGSRRVAHIDEENEENAVVYWDELTVEFRPMENQINPEE